MEGRLMRPAWDDQFAEDDDERQAKRRRAMQACFEDCAAGAHLDPENGVVNKCPSWEHCQGWRAYT